MSRLARLRFFAVALVAIPSLAQGQEVRTVDPSGAMRGNGAAPAVPAGNAGTGDAAAPATGFPAPVPPSAEAAAATTESAATYQQDDVISAAEDVFGRGAEGLAKIIENILRDQGEPNGYIAGREAGGAFIAGLRYGSGVMHHKVEGERPVFWTGPSVGFDFGANGAKTFVLVYNLYDSQELFRRYPAAEGTAYVIGGFTASYLRRGDVVLIPIRLGVGWRLGVNVGYMKFTEKSKWLPF